MRFFMYENFTYNFLLLFVIISLLLAEIEQVAKTKDLFVEKELLQPGDEGFVAPKLD